MNKTMYFYWGNQTISFLRYMTIKSFIHYNPDFETVLITRTNPEKLTITNKGFEEKEDSTYFDGKDYTKELMSLDITYQILEDDYPDIAKLNMPNASIDDILGWYIMGFIGGFKADMDILFTKPIDITKFENVDMTIFSYYNNFAIGFLYGEPNKLMQEMFKVACQTSVKNYQDVGGRLYFKFIVMHGNVYDANIKIMDNRIIYPFIYEEAFEKSLDIPWVDMIPDLLPRTIGIHWYGGWKTSRKYNSLLTAENYREHPNTITYHIHEVLK